MSVPNPTKDGTCLITGASSGIGEAIARDLAARGYNVTLAARRVERLQDLATELTDAHGVDAAAVQCDVTDEAQVGKLLDGIEQAGKQIDILVNNAGRGSTGKFFEDSYESEMAQIDLNVRALASMTHRVLPGMVERGGGAVLNVASTAAFQPMPRQNVYAASKAFVLYFSEGLAQELSGTGVSCTVLCPGPTKTEFFADDMDKYVENSPGFVWQSAEDVAKAGVEGMFKRKRTVVPKLTNRVGAISGHLTPRFVTLPMIDRFWPVGKL